MKIQFVTVGGPDVASTRVRALGLAERLEGRGHRVGVMSAEQARRTWGRQLGRRTDVLVLQKVFPAPWVVKLLRLRCRVLVVDLDDALHLGNPDLGRHDVRGVERRVRAALELADLVTSPSDLLVSDMKEWISEALVFPGPAPSPRCVPSSSRSRGLIWLGSPSTEQNLRLLRSSEAVIRDWPDGAVAVGGYRTAIDAGFTPMSWTPETEADQLCSSSLGVMPLARSPWNDRKAAYKVLEYMASGVQPVASASPALNALGALRRNVRIVEDPDDWPDVLAGLRSETPLDERQSVALQEATRAVNQDAYVDAWTSAVEALVGRGAA